MIALARAGCTKREGAPTAPETERSDSTDYVEAPLDVLMKYHVRLVRSAAEAPQSNALAWIQQRDEEERALWVERFRHSALPLGKIVKELCEQRGHMWEVCQAPGTSAAVGAGARTPPPPSVPQSFPARAAERSKKDGGGSLKMATHLKNGKEICRNFNRGKCSEPCPRDLLHVCAAYVSKSGRVCGMRNHTAQECRSAVKA